LLIVASKFLTTPKSWLNTGRHGTTPNASGHEAILSAFGSAAALSARNPHNEKSRSSAANNGSPAGPFLIPQNAGF
jgi:hypothetical protein